MSADAKNEAVRKRHPPGNNNEEDVPNGPQVTVLRQVMYGRTRERIQELLHERMAVMSLQMEGMLEEIMQEVESTGTAVTDALKTSPSEAKAVHKEKRALMKKEFVARNSILTDLLEVNHIRTIRHIFIAILMLLFLSAVVGDILDGHGILLSFDLITWSFGQPLNVATIWIGMFLCTLAIYPVFKYWAQARQSMSPSVSGVVDKVFLTSFVAYLLTFMYIPAAIVVALNLPTASSAIVIMEQVRLAMKTHAFVRSNAGRAIKFKPKSDDGDILCPDFAKYLYFLFAPTLVYRDSYPRTNRVRWGFVIASFAQVVACIFYIYFVFEYFLIPVFTRFGHEDEPKFGAKRLALTMFHCMLPGAVAMLCSFYCVLHSWLNAWAEILRFADRMFYRDWWNASSYSAYYRTWNVVVHDWLHAYIYRDLSFIFASKKRESPIPLLAVFLVSAVVHEYILTLVFRFCYPILFVMFAGFGVLLIPITKHFREHGTIFQWATYIAGQGLLFSLYSMEWYARKNCPSTVASYLDFFVPRSWTCNAV